MDYGHRFSKEDIERLFGEKFHIFNIEEIRNTGPSEGEVYLYSVYMEKK